jgi:carnosine N-methyltransferase
MFPSNSPIDELFCPLCHRALASAKCQTCDRTYPILRDRIPVLLENAQTYLTSFHRTCQEYCDRVMAQIQAVDRAAADRPERRQIIDRYQLALATHAGIMQSLMADVKPHLQSTTLAAGKLPDIPYGSRLSYVRRDWCGEEICETELATIQETLRALAHTIDAPRNKTLVLGAGVGRTAWDLCDWLPDVTAVDLSCTMACLFDRVLEAPFDVYQINRSNTLRTEDLVQRKTTQPPARQAKENRNGRFRYWIADAQQLPLPDQSMDVVISIYFTDVLPLDQLLKEVKRVLKSGGIFIHYGPLEYHFEDFAASLSAEEVRDQLASHHFHITEERTVASTHLATSGQMVHHIFDNWAFSAKDHESRKKPLAFRF